MTLQACKARFELSSMIMMEHMQITPVDACKVSGHGGLADAGTTMRAVGQLA